MQGVDAPDTVLLLEINLLAFALTKLLFFYNVVIHHLLMMILNTYQPYPPSQIKFKRVDNLSIPKSYFNNNLFTFKFLCREATLFKRFILIQ